MSLLLFLLRASRLRVAAAFLAGMVGGAANVGLIATINQGVANYQRGEPAPVRQFVVLCAIMLVASITSQVVMVRLSRRAVYDLQIHMSKRILNTPLRRLEELGPHRLLATLTSDIQAVAGALTLLPLLGVNFMTILICALYLGWLSLPLLVTTMVFVALGAASYYLPLTQAMGWLARARDTQDTLFHHFRGLIHGNKELKLHARRRRAFLAEDLEPTADQVRHRGVVGMTIFSIASTWGNLLFFVFIALILFVAPRFVEVEATTISSFIVASLFVLNSVAFLLDNMPMLGNARVSLNKVESLGLDLEEEERGEAPPAPRRAWRRLELRGVTHTYYVEREDSSFTLGPIDMELEPGELVFLVGGNGSGKTTLAKVLLGLYLPEEGSLVLDGEEIGAGDLEAYRQMFSVVFDDFHLFESLLGFRGEENERRARHYLQELQIEHKVTVADGELSTTELSRGQRKRLALLTAYLEDRPIYVFDEWAADQDPIFKELFYTQILSDLKARGKGVLAITHDDHYFHLADRVIKLDYGRVEFEKPVDELAAANAEVGIA